MVEGGLRAPLLDRSSMYQVGGQPGHRTEELVYTMKSVIAKRRREGKQVVIQMFDISKFFDKELIEDAVVTCLRRGADPKAVRLWHKLNQDTKIRVRTGAGMSREGSVGAVLGQGTLGGALISQAVLDDGVASKFLPGEDMSYGAVPLAPMMYQDDILHGMEGMEEARRAATRMNCIMKERALTLNREKSVCLVMGNKAQRRAASIAMLANPVVCGEVELKEQKVWKWLGQHLSSEGLGASVAATVAAREGRVRGACLEIAQIVNDWRAGVVGGLDTALILWEMCVVPSLLYGAGTWVEVTRATVDKLNSLQRWFARLVLQVGPGTPGPALTWETGLMDMGLRIKMEKLMLVFHLKSLDEEALARKIYDEQKKKQWPGLAEETKKICEELVIEDVNTTSKTKKEFKKIVKKACEIKDEENLRKLAQKSKKCERMLEDRFGKKEYLLKQSIYKARKYFTARVGMTRFAGNFSNDLKFKRTNWMCLCLVEREVESHLTSSSCPVYADIRENYGDLSSDDELVRYFGEVLARREALEEEEE